MAGKSGDFLALNMAVLTVSDSRGVENDGSGRLLYESMVEAGHNVVERALVRDDRYAIRAAVSGWIASDEVQVVVCTGGTGLFERDVTVEAVSVLFDKDIDGFGEVFRYLSYKEIGTSAMQSRVCGGIANTTLIFALPGSVKACRLGWDIIRQQCDRRISGCSFVNVLGAGAGMAGAGTDD